MLNALTTLADLLPTFVDIATDGKPGPYAGPIVGVAFDLPEADFSDDIVFFEYC